MSLNCDYSKIGNHEELCKVKNDDGTYSTSPATTTISFCTMILGLGSITEKNLDEWRFRLAYMEYAGDSPLAIPVADAMPVVEKHIGLTANVSDESRAAWLRRINEARAREVQYQLQRQKAGEPYSQWYIVTGRLDGDDADSCIVVNDCCEGGARDKLIAQLLETLNDDDPREAIISTVVACGRVRPIIKEL